MSIICDRRRDAPQPPKTMPLGQGRLSPWEMSVGLPASLLSITASLGFVLFFCFGSGNAEVTHFEGGSLSAGIEGNWSPFAFNGNTGARGSMNAVSTLYPSASSWFGNPAALGDQLGLSTQGDFFLPGLGLGISSERLKLLRQNLRQPIKDYLDLEGNNSPHPVYPDVDLRLYQSTNLSGFNLAWGNGRSAFGGGVQQPFQGKLDFAVGGIALGMADLLDSNNAKSDSIKIEVAGDLFASLRSELNDFALGWAARPKPWLRLGFTYHRYTFDGVLDAQAAFEGTLQRGAKKVSFNDSTLDYSNGLGGVSRADLKGIASGFRFGAAADFNEHFGVDLAAGFSETMRLEGQMKSAWQLPTPIDISGPNIFDPAKLDTSHLALTQKLSNTIDSIQVVLPWDLSVSFRAQFENLRINFDYTYFLRNLGLKIRISDTDQVFDRDAKQMAKNTDGTDSLAITDNHLNYSLALQQQFALGVEYDQVFLQIGLVDYGIRQTFLHEATAWTPSFMPFIPTLNMGYHFPIGPRFNVTVSLLAFPVSLFKTSVEYRY